MIVWVRLVASVVWDGEGRKEKKGWRPVFISTNYEWAAGTIRFHALPHHTTARGKCTSGFLLNRTGKSPLQGGSSLDPMLVPKSDPHPQKNWAQLGKSISIILMFTKSVISVVHRVSMILSIPKVLNELLPPPKIESRHVGDDACASLCRSPPTVPQREVKSFVRPGSCSDKNILVNSCPGSVRKT